MRKFLSFLSLLSCLSFCEAQISFQDAPSSGGTAALTNLFINGVALPVSSSYATNAIVVWPIAPTNILMRVAITNGIPYCLVGCKPYTITDPDLTTEGLPGDALGYTQLGTWVESPDAITVSYAWYTNSTVLVTTNTGYNLTAADVGSTFRGSITRSNVFGAVEVFTTSYGPINYWRATGGSVVSGGTGYIVDDILVPNVGVHSTTTVTIRVTSIDEMTGAVTGFSIEVSGVVISNPEETLSVSGGTGSECTVTLSWENITTPQ